MLAKKKATHYQKKKRSNLYFMSEYTIYHLKMICTSHQLVRNLNSNEKTYSYVTSMLATVSVFAIYVSRGRRRVMSEWGVKVKKNTTTRSTSSANYNRQERRRGRPLNLKPSVLVFFFIKRANEAFKF